MSTALCHWFKALFGENSEDDDFGFVIDASFYQYQEESGRPTLPEKSSSSASRGMTVNSTPPDIQAFLSRICAPRANLTLPKQSSNGKLGFAGRFLVRPDKGYQSCSPTINKDGRGLRKSLMKVLEFLWGIRKHSADEAKGIGGKSRSDLRALLDEESMKRIAEYVTAEERYCLP